MNILKKDMNNFTGNIKIIITENQYNSLLKILPPLLKRRINEEEMNLILQYVYSEVRHHLQPYYKDDFDSFAGDIVHAAVHDFIANEKGHEIETEIDPEFGEVWNNESRHMVFNLYWPLIPHIEKIAKDRLYELWMDIFYN